MCDGEDWIVVASKLGAPVIRVFAGPEPAAGYTFDQALDWMVSDFKQCAAFGREHGVVVGLQQHNDFLKTAEETIRVIQAEIRSGSHRFSTLAAFAPVILMPRLRNSCLTLFPGRSRRRWAATASRSDRRWKDQGHHRSARLPRIRAFRSARSGRRKAQDRSFPCNDSCGIWAARIATKHLNGLDWHGVPNANNHIGTGHVERDEAGIETSAVVLREDFSAIGCQA